MRPALVLVTVCALPSAKVSTQGPLGISILRQVVSSSPKYIRGGDERALLVSGWTDAESYALGWRRARDAVRARVEGVIKPTTVDGVVHVECRAVTVDAVTRAYAAAIARQFALWGVREIRVLTLYPAHTSACPGARTARSLLEAAGATVGELLSARDEHELMGAVYGARAAAQFCLGVTSFVAGVARKDGRFVTPNVGLPGLDPGGAENRTVAGSWTFPGPELAALAVALHWHMWAPELDESFARPTEDGDDTCAWQWSWRSLDLWAPAALAGENVVLTRPRSGAKNARGTAEMRASFSAVPPRSAVVKVMANDALSPNPWHRITAQYSAWFALQTVAPGVPRDGVVVELPCESSGVGSLVFNGWDAVARNVTCGPVDSFLHPERTKFDVTLYSPSYGVLLWDLAWDTTLRCHETSMFDAFVRQFELRSSRHAAKNPVCFLDRGPVSKMRNLVNKRQVLDAIESELQHEVRSIILKADDPTSHVVATLKDCRVMVGAHGANMVNVIFARPAGGLVIEFLTADLPAYYANLAALRNHTYVGIVDHKARRYVSHAIEADIPKLRQALRRYGRSSLK